MSVSKTFLLPTQHFSVTLHDWFSWQYSHRSKLLSYKYVMNYNRGSQLRHSQLLSMACCWSSFKLRSSRNCSCFSKAKAKNFGVTGLGFTQLNKAKKSWPNWRNTNWCGKPSKTGQALLPQDPAATLSTAARNADDRPPQLKGKGKVGWAHRG